MADTAVVHLVRKANGLAPFARFLQSYRDHPAGAPHELVLLFKGFRGDAVTPAYERLVEPLAHCRQFIPDQGFDLHAYFWAVQRLRYDHFCFLNSFSRILAPDWLAKLQAPLASPACGVTGATASCESLAALPPPKGWLTRRHFAPFPNYHLRTNAFVASRALLSRVTLPYMRFKYLALTFESGKHGLTRQAAALGLEAQVVDRHGAAFRQDQWHLSNTFRQSLQQDLLVSDNQTEAYATANAVVRARLSRLAWGDWARPA